MKEDRSQESGVRSLNNEQMLKDKKSEFIILLTPDSCPPSSFFPHPSSFSELEQVKYPECRPF